MSARGPGSRPNLVLIMVDQWRGDCLSGAGHPVAHTLYRKTYPYEGSARVPLIVAGPPSLGLRPGSSIGAVVELRDLMPTLLECAGATIPGSVQGRSFLPLARGDQAPLRESLHGEHTSFRQSLQWLTDGHEKYVWWSGTGREQLFDIERDPQELHDLAPEEERSPRLGRWRELLARELAGREEGFVEGNTLTSGRPVRPTLSHLRRDDP